MKITSTSFGCMDPGVGGKARAGILSDLRLFKKSGIGCEERDLPDIPYRIQEFDLAYQQYLELEKAGIHEHLLGIKTDPKWAKKNPLEYERALKHIVTIHPGHVSYIIGREPPFTMTPAAYADWLIYSREVLIDYPIVFANAPYPESSKTYYWLKTVINRCRGALGDKFVNIFGMAWHTSFGSQLWRLTDTVGRLRQMLPKDMPIWMVEGGTWGAANTFRTVRQTDEQQAMANLALASHAFNLGIERVFFGFQDTYSAGKDFYGYGMVDIFRKPKLLYKWLREYIAEMNHLNTLK